MTRIAPFHGLTTLFLLGLILLTIYFRGQIPNWFSLLLFYLSGLGMVFLLQLSFDRKKMGRVGMFFYFFSPIIFVILIYQSLGNLIHYLIKDIDHLLIKIDLFIFGTHPTIWMERWIVPWFTDLMSFAYVSYYFLPVILIGVLYVKNRLKEFERSIFILTFGYYISFIGYILFPAIGPRFTLAHLQSVPLEGSLFTDLIRDTLNTLEHNKRDCMPSGHTQIALMVLSLSYRYQRIIFYIFLPLVSGLILSTVYLRYHYVIDLLAGVAFALGCMVMGPQLFEWWDKLYKKGK